MYMLFFLLNKYHLPWCDFQENFVDNKIDLSQLLKKRIKSKMTQKLLATVPTALHSCFKQVLSLDFEERPNYELIRTQLYTCLVDELRASKFLPFSTTAPTNSAQRTLFLATINSDWINSVRAPSLPKEPKKLTTLNQDLFQPKALTSKSNQSFGLVSLSGVNFSNISVSKFSSDHSNNSKINRDPGSG